MKAAKLKRVKALPKKRLAIVLASIIVMITGVAVFALLNRDGSTDASTKEASQVQQQADIKNEDGSAVAEAASVNGAQTGQGTAPNSPQGSDASKPAAPKASTGAAQPATAKAPAISPGAKPPASSYAIPPHALQVTSVTINGSFVQQPGTCSSSSGYPYTYDIYFNSGKGPATLSANWEYEMLGPGQFAPTINPVLQGYPLSTGMYRMTNTSPYDAKVYIYSSTAGAYRARLHVLSPNSVYSNWVTIPQQQGC